MHCDSDRKLKASTKSRLAINNDDLPMVSKFTVIFPFLCLSMFWSKKKKVLCHIRINFFRFLSTFCSSFAMQIKSS